MAQVTIQASTYSGPQPHTSTCTCVCMDTFVHLYMYRHISVSPLTCPLKRWVFGRYEWHVDLSSDVFGCSAGYCIHTPSGVDIMHKLWTLCSNFSTKFFHTCHIYGHKFAFYHFKSLSITLTLAGGHKVSMRKIWLVHFVAHFSTEWDQIWYGNEAI